MPARLSASLWRELDEGENCWLSYGAGHLVYILKSIKRRGHRSGFCLSDSFHLSRSPFVALPYSSKSTGCHLLNVGKVKWFQIWACSCQVPQFFSHPPDKNSWRKKRGSITHTDITFHHDNDTLRSVQALLTLDAGPYCVIIAQTSDPSSNAFIVLHLIRFLFSRFFCRNMRGRGSGVALLWLIYHLGHESDWRIALDGTVTKQPHLLCGLAVHMRWYVLKWGVFGVQIHCVIL